MSVTIASIAGAFLATSCSSSSSAPKASATAVGAPGVVAFSAGVANCTKKSDPAARVTLYWRSSNAASVWIASYPNPNATGDPKTTPNARGPLPPNASVQVVFNCADAANPNTFRIGVYGSNGAAQYKSITVKRNF